MKKNNLKTIVNFLYEVGTARNIVRSHYQVIRNANDTIAAHSFRVAIIGLILAELEKANEDKVLKMCLLHDLAELRTGDANFINKYYRVEDEEKAIQDQWKDIVGGKKVISLLKEYNERKSKEAKVAKDADILDQIFLQKEYLSQRPYDFKKWHNYHEKRLKTKSALQIARLVFKTESMDWVYDFAGLLKQNKKKKSKK
jgi:putative hydrolase of HD superfamily